MRGTLMMSLFTAIAAILAALSLFLLIITTSAIRDKDAGLDRYCDATFYLLPDYPKSERRF